MKSITRKSDSSQPAAETAVYLFDDWFDPIEAGVRDRVREFIQAMVEGELDAALMRPRYGRRSQSSSGDADGPVGVTGHRHGHRSRSLMGTFGRTEIAVPRARLDGPDGQTTEWKSKILRASCCAKCCLRPRVSPYSSIPPILPTRRSPCARSKRPAAPWDCSSKSSTLV